MAPEDASRHQVADLEGTLSVSCDACAAVLQSPARDNLSFLLLDGLTTPLLGCVDHLTRFTAVCGYTTTDTAELLSHRPAGGVGCPSCQFAPTTPHHPIIPVADGAVAALACPEHHTELRTRFHTGLETQHQLTTHLDIARHDCL